MSSNTAEQNAPKKPASKCDLLTIYEGARDGLSDTQIAALCGITQQAFGNWKKRRPPVRDALARGRAFAAAHSVPAFLDFVYQRLPEELKPLWEEINAMDLEDAPPARLEAFFSRNGVRARQHLFLYALVSNCFNVSEAMRKIGLNRKALDHWRKFDPGFAELMDEIHWHKQNFFESALLQRVEAGDTQAIIFANRTQNRDRGYNDKLDINLQGEVKHAHAHFSVDELNLPIETRRQLLTAIREKSADGESTPQSE